MVGDTEGVGVEMTGKVYPLRRSRRKKSMWERLKLRLLGVWWWWTGNLLNVQLEDKTSKMRTEAQIALDRVVFETHIPPDCVTACIVRGGPCIRVKHDFSQEAFIGNTYAHAADKALEWINTQGEELVTEKTTKMTHKDIKVFDAQRRKIATAVRAEKTRKRGLN